MPRLLTNSSRRARFRRPLVFDTTAASLYVYLPFKTAIPEDMILGNACVPSANFSVLGTPMGDLCGVFNGTDTFLDLPSSNANKIDVDPMTLTARVLFNSTAEQICLQKGSDLDNSVSYGFGIDASGHLSWMQGNDFTGNSSYTPPTGEWLYLGFKRRNTGTTIEYFVNGVSQGTFSYTKSPVSTTKTLTLGTRGVATAGSTSSRGLHFSGRMTDLRIYLGIVSDGVIWGARSPGLYEKLRSNRRGVRAKSIPPPPPPPPAPIVFGGPPIVGAPWLIRTNAAPLYVPGPVMRGAPVFTGALGTVNSQFGQFTPGTVAASSVITQPQAQLFTVFGGPPIPGAPWLLRTVAPQPVIAAPRPAIPSVPPLFVSGGPIPMAPWNPRLRPAVDALNLRINAPPPVQAPQPPPPNVQGGPIFGVPWNPNPLPVVVSLNVAPPVPPVSQPPPSVQGGPPIVGAPWRQLRIGTPGTFLTVRPVTPPPPPGPYPQISGGPIPFAPWRSGRPATVAPTPGPTPPQPTPPLATGAVGVVNVVPSEDRRLAKHTEITAQILNSLIQSGQLGQTGPADWALQVTVLTFNGRTGAVTFQTSDLPPSGVVAGTYAFPVVTVDTYGRVTGITAPQPSAGVPLIGTSVTTAPVFGTTGVAIDSRFGVVNNMGNSGSGTVTFDLTLSDCHLLTLTGTPTLALANVGNVRIFTLILKQDGTGSRTVNWFSGVLWNGGSAPTLTTAAGKYDVITFINLGGGVYLGQPAGQNF
jgi:hypothetical protein